MANEVERATRHFLISYTDADRAWAEWIGVQLEAYGYQTVLRAWDFRPGQNLVLEMNEAIENSQRTLLVVTRAYLASDEFVQWASAFRKDPRGKQGLVLPVRVEACELGGLLGSLETLDLFRYRVEEAEIAAKVLLDGVLQIRGKPTSAPFPGVTPADLKAQEEKFHYQVKQTEQILYARDYDMACTILHGLLSTRSQDYYPYQHARLLYFQSLAILKGKRPCYLVANIVESSSQLLAQARREDALRTYTATMAAIENDFARGGLRRAGIQPQQLLEQARRIPVTDQDRPLIEMLEYLQPELFQAFRILF